MKVLLPFIPLRMIPHATRWAGDRVKECVFVTRPNFTKVEVKNYLEKACGLSGIERVDTCNYEGKKKTFTNRKTKKKTFFRRQDFKKAYVKFKVRAEEAAAALCVGLFCTCESMHDGVDVLLMYDDAYRRSLLTRRHICSR